MTEWIFKMQLWKKSCCFLFFFLKETQRVWPLQTCHNSYISNILFLLHKPNLRSLLIDYRLKYAADGTITEAVNGCW